MNAVQSDPRVRRLTAAPAGNAALFLDCLVVAVARPLLAISAERPSPRSISIVSKRLGTPIAAILLTVVLNAVLIVGPFRNLVVIDVIVFISASLPILIMLFTAHAGASDRSAVPLCFYGSGPLGEDAA